MDNDVARWWRGGGTVTRWRGVLWRRGGGRQPAAPTTHDYANVPFIMLIGGGTPSARAAPHEASRPKALSLQMPQPRIFPSAMSSPRAWNIHTFHVNFDGFSMELSPNSTRDMAKFTIQFLRFDP